MAQPINLKYKQNSSHFLPTIIFSLSLRASIAVKF